MRKRDHNQTLPEEKGFLRSHQHLNRTSAASGGQGYSADPTLHTIGTNRFRKSIHQLRQTETFKTMTISTGVLPTELPFRFTQCPERNFQSGGAQCGDSAPGADAEGRAPVGGRGGEGSEREAEPGPQPRRCPSAAVPV